MILNGLGKRFFFENISAPPNQLTPRLPYLQLSSVASTLSLVQERLSTALRTVVEENSVLSERVRELEDSTGDIHRLRMENERLVERFKGMTWTPDQDELVRERDDALRKLENMRNVMRDLLQNVDIRLGDEDPENEIRTMHSESGSSTPRTVGSAIETQTSTVSLPLTNMTIVLDAYKPPSSSTTSITGPPTGAGEGFVLGAPFSASKVTATQKSAHGRMRRRTSSNITNSPVQQLLSTPQRMLELSPGSSDSGMSVRYDPQASPAFVSGVGAKWRIHFSKPPASIKVLEGPMETDELIGIPGLDQETISSLNSLHRLQTDTMRIHVSGSNAFIYDPVILEGPSGSYIVDWNRPKVNRNVASYISGASKDKGALNTFIFSTKKHGLTRTRVSGRLVPPWVAELDSRECAPYMADARAEGRRSRLFTCKQAQRALAMRRARGLSLTDVSRLLEQDELVQFAVELRAASSPSASSQGE
ncbi:hypothetical protein EW146_g4208 [Bondarzewia mesenterica]|uniref:Uncharacterized protein n=1 Tax=Bondarzewia mesenterica TaxID=1095465 RepID=A0A4S4LVF2_9AGAM|nr:hypothetical protein EW146_g4208 [Bondarzewia mesenterica]